MLALLYLLLTFLLGDSICRRFFRFTSIQHRLAAAFLFGLLFSTWLTYFSAIIFSGTTRPLFWANVVFFLVVGAVCFLLWQKSPLDQPGDGSIKSILHRLSTAAGDATLPIGPDAERRPLGDGRLDWICLGVCLIAGIWLMFATLDFSEGSFKFAVKAWSDFGANLSLSQSMALGNNFPTEHPFFPGEPVRYHFLFWFQAANLSYLGLNLVWAVNFLSLLSLAALLALVMTLAEVLFNSRAVGRIAAVLFFFGATSLTYIPFLLSQPGVGEAFSAIIGSTDFLNSGYPFRGETWGGLSVNIYAYQRHLITGSAMLVAVIVFLIDLYRRGGNIPALEYNQAGISDTEIAVDPAISRSDDVVLELDDPAIDRSESLPNDLQDSESLKTVSPENKVITAPLDFRLEIAGLVLCGIMIGGLPYWNSAVFVSAAIVIGSFLIFFPYRFYLAILIGTAVVIGLPQVLMLRSGTVPQTTDSLLQWGYLVANPTVPLVLEYIGWSFGLKLMLLGIALWLVSGTHRRLFIVFSSLVPVVFLLHLTTDAFNNHKLLNIWNILIGTYVAYAIWRVGRGGIGRIVLAVALTFLMVFTSIVDLFPLHNDRFVSVPFTDDRLTNWVLANTQPKDIFLADTLLAHPILFSGRKVFLGNTLFAWSAGFEMAEKERTYREMFQEKDVDRLNQLLSVNNVDYVAIDDGLRRNNTISNLNESVYRDNFERVFDDNEHKYDNLDIYKVASFSRGAYSGTASTSQIPETRKPPVNVFSGGKGNQPGQLSVPRGIAVDSKGDFYVADAGNSRIQKFNPAGEHLAMLGTAGKAAGELSDPNGIVVDSTGSILTVDAGNHRLLRLNPDGTFVKEWIGPDRNFFGPRDLAIGPNNFLFILDQGWGRVVRLDLKTDEFVEWGKKGPGEGEFFEPTGIDVGGDRVFVADARNDRIQVFDLNGQFIAAWPVPEWNSYPWHYPDAAFDPTEKRLYVSSPQTKEILVFDANGNRLAPLKADDAAGLDDPSSLAIANTKAGKRLYVLNTNGARVSVFELGKGSVK